eukprot:1189211-Prorocentrum_minimum.AAC.4
MHVWNRVAKRAPTASRPRAEQVSTSMSNTTVRRSNPTYTVSAQPCCQLQHNNCVTPAGLSACAAQRLCHTCGSLGVCGVTIVSHLRVSRRVQRDDCVTHLREADGGALRPRVPLAVQTDGRPLSPGGQLSPKCRRDPVQLGEVVHQDQPVGVRGEAGQRERLPRRGQVLTPRTPHCARGAAR